MITIEPTIFINARTSKKTYGVRVYDEYGKSYDNTWDKIPTNDMDVLEKVITESDDPDIHTSIEFIKENKEGVNIGGENYNWHEIKDILG